MSQDREDKETTEKVKKLMDKYTHQYVAEQIGITKKTLYTRIKRDNWKKAERYVIHQVIQ